jgi:hypothetical protein
MLLQIDVTATDSEGNVASETVEVEVTDSASPAAEMRARPYLAMEAQAGPPAEMPPTGDKPPGTELGGMPEPRDTIPAPPRAMAGQANPEARVMAAQPTQIPGLGNATGHNSAVPTSTPPRVTQAQRSQTLYNNTGGFR